MTNQEALLECITYLLECSDCGEILTQAETDICVPICAESVADAADTEGWEACDGDALCKGCAADRKAE